MKRREFIALLGGAAAATSLSEDKLAGGLAYVIEATSIGGRFWISTARSRE
jgi:hypothetical protein